MSPCADEKKTVVGRHQIEQYFRGVRGAVLLGPMSDRRAPMPADRKVFAETEKNKGGKSGHQIEQPKNVRVVCQKKFLSSVRFFSRVGPDHPTLGCGKILAKGRKNIVLFGVHPQYANRIDQPVPRYWKTVLVRRQLALGLGLVV